MGGLNNRPPNAAGTILGRKKTPEDIEFEKERERRVQQAEDEAKKLRERLAKICNSLLEDASRELANDNDASLLSKHCEWLNSSINNLDAILKFTPSAIRRGEILYIVTELLWNGQLIARSGTARTVKKLGALRANDAKMAKASLERQHLRLAILDETKGVPLVGSDSFAESIRDGVRKHESLKKIIEKKQEKKRKGWPSKRTIRREIEAILIECRNT